MILVMVHATNTPIYSCKRKYWGSGDQVQPLGSVVCIQIDIIQSGSQRLGVVMEHRTIKHTNKLTSPTHISTRP